MEAGRKYKETRCRGCTDNEGPGEGKRTTAKRTAGEVIRITEEHRSKKSDNRIEAGGGGGGRTG